MNRDEWEKFFEDYYFDRLDVKSRRDLEDAFKRDPDLEEEYKEFTRIAEVGKLSQIKAELRNKPEVRRILDKKAGWRGFSSIWLILLLGAILIIGLFMVWPSQGAVTDIDDDLEVKGSVNELPTEEAAPETDQFKTDDEAEILDIDPDDSDYQLESTGEINRRQAMALEYLERSYTDDILLRGVDTISPLDQTTLFNSCVQYFRVVDFSSAIECINEHESIVSDTEKNWLLALAHLGLDEREEAASYLDRVVNDRFSIFFPNARSLQLELSD